jgi:hypothetical protein
MFAYILEMTTDNEMLGAMWSVSSRRLTSILDNDWTENYIPLHVGYCF